MLSCCRQIVVVVDTLASGSYTIICNLIHNGSLKVHNINSMTAQSHWPVKCCCRRATDMLVEEGRSCSAMLMTGALCYRIGTELLSSIMTKM